MEIEQLEAIALASDRTTGLSTLLPGTPEHDYWSGIALQHTGRLDDVDALLAGWIKRHGDYELFERLERRQLLLRAGENLPAHADALRRAAQVTLDDRAEVVAQAERFPTRLDPALIEGERLVEQERAKHPDLSTLTDEALPELAARGAELTAASRRALLQRLSRANLPGLVALIAQDLDERSSSGFGSLPIHAQLTLAQLEELVTLRPAFRDAPSWVDAVLTRLRPSTVPDHPAEVERERRALLDRVWRFALTLPPAFNGLKAVVLYHQLSLDRSHGVYDRARFDAYLALPRYASYVSREWMNRTDERLLVRPGANEGRAAGLEPLPDDEALVREYLAHFLLAEDGAAFTDRVRADWLAVELATTRLLAGAPEPERWAATLGPARLAALNERVDIELTARNPARFTAAERVTLEVDVKNVRELEVKVFRINTIAYFLGRNSTEVDTSLDLDGMVAQDERTLRFDTPPMRSTRQRLELAGCDRPGTYVVELIGNGRSSRALVRKGSLRHDVRIGAAGAVVTVFDEAGALVRDARLWLAGRELTSREDGGITIPFSTRPGAVPVLLVDGDLTQRVMIDLPAEQIELKAGMHVERESLVPNRSARILCRPTLTIGGVRTSLALIEEPHLSITVGLLDGTQTMLDRPLTLTDDAEAIVDLTIPDGAIELSVELAGRVRMRSTQRTIPVSANRIVAPFNQIHGTAETEAAHLTTTAGPEHTLFLLGKSGEPLGGRALAVTLRHETSSAFVTVTLETDARGAIALGALEGITHVGVHLPSGTAQDWKLEPIFESLRVVHAEAGTPVLLPAPPGVRAGVPEDLVLVDLRGGAPAYDVTKAVTLDARALVVTGLGPGTYRLSCRGTHDVTIVIAAPGDRSLELSPETPLLREARIEDGMLTIRTSAASEEARVHVMALRYQPTNALESTLHRPPTLPRTSRRAPRFSQYISGRDIGEEYRYVLARRSGRPRLGTMLEKPGLLLNPWALRTTATSVQHAAAGAAYPAAAPAPGFAAPSPPMAMGRAFGAGAAKGGIIKGFPSLDFLPSAAIVIDNLRPDEHGVIRVPLAELGAAQTVRIVLVDPTLTSTLDVPLGASDVAPRDLRLRLALDPAKHFVEDRRAAAAPAGDPIVVEDVRTGKVELIATLDRARTLLLTLIDAGEALDELAFLTSWSTLDDTKKRAHYSKCACHEVHLFVWRKDPAFFASVVRPYLAHKRHPSFVDEFLLGHDLSAYLEPWRFDRLNALERILLGAAIPAVRDAVARLTGDEVDLLPHDAGRDAHLLATLLGAGALEPAAPMAAAFESRAMADLDEAMPAANVRRAMASAAPEQAKQKRRKGGGGAFTGDISERERDFVMYRGVDRTQEWAETGWWQQRLAQSGPELVPPNRFWRDLARHDGKGPFLSPHLADCTTSATAALCALAFLDLPFTAETPESVLDDTRLTLTPRSHALAAVSRVAPIEAPASRSAVLIGQTYFRADDRYDWDGAERREKPVTGELVVGVVYACHVVVTNPAASQQQMDVLLQIPKGSIPVDSGAFTRTRPLVLQPYGTQSIEYAFYFPKAGTWSHFPAHVTRDGELLAFAEPRELEVVDTLSTVDQTSWAYVSQHGTVDDVLAFLDRANLGRIELDRIAWRMHDRSAFERVTKALTTRHVYEDVLWKYALAHHDRVRAAEWLKQQDAFLRLAGPALQQVPALAHVDPHERGWYEHLEYAPLINARAHQLGAKKKILNDGLASHYRTFLEVVAHRPRATPDDLLAAAHYLLTMDRVDDAIALLARIDPAAVSGPMQYAYVAGYVATLQGDLASARRLAAPWVDSPVDRWRHRFAALVAMLDEAEGAPAAVVDPDDRTQHLGAAAAREPGLELSAERGIIAIRHQALSRCQVRFYPMNVELLFSRQPFVQGDVERFSWIEPRLVIDVPLTTDGRTDVPIPPELGTANLVIEAVGDGVRRAVAHYAHDLGVQITQAFGQVRITRASTHAVLPATYVKVFARQANGQISFYKDGYTDPRGRFDYATLSTDDLDRVERFALLVASTDAGATIVETTPPAR